MRVESRSDDERPPPLRVLLPFRASPDNRGDLTPEGVGTSRDGHAWTNRTLPENSGHSVMIIKCPSLSLGATGYVSGTGIGNTR